MPRKKRSDSVAGDVSAFSGALTPIEPPKKLNKFELVHWYNITCARAREDWTQIDLYRAWNLAKLYFYIEQAHKEIEKQGMAFLNEKGTLINNPAFSRLEVLTRLASSEATKLHVHAEATVGKSEDSAKRATKQRQAENTLNILDSLIARPQVN